MEFNPTNLVSWFQVNYKELVQIMSECSHHYDKDNLNPYHLEGDIFTHTMMVFKEACDIWNDENNSKCSTNDSIEVHQKWMEPYNNLLVAALLHDIGKPSAAKLKHDKKYKAFYGHDPVSAFLSIEILHRIEKDFNIILDKTTIFQTIALHTEVYKLKPEEISKRLICNHKLASLMGLLAHCDDYGRFTTIDQGRLTKIDVEYDFERLVTCDVKPHLVMTIGLPCSGKSTYSKSLVNYSLLSRDEYIEKYAIDNNLNYRQAFEALDSKEIDRVFYDKLSYLTSPNRRCNVVLDRTNLTRKGRISLLKRFTGYDKTAIVFLPTMEDLKKRSECRTGKEIPDFVYNNMMETFYPPLWDEGWDDIQWRF